MIRKATRADASGIATTLTRAFDTDPFLTWMVRPDRSREESLRVFFDMALYPHTLPHDEVYTTEDADGAALWVPPGKWSTSILAQLPLMPRFLRAVGWSRAFKVLKGVGRVERRHPTKPHYYLYVLGVDPSKQGRGLGKKLVAPTLARCDAESIGAYLETAKETNLRLYESLGFKVTDRFEVAADGPTMWCMWRDPRQ